MTNTKTLIIILTVGFLIPTIMYLATDTPPETRNLTIGSVVRLVGEQK